MPQTWCGIYDRIAPDRWVYRQYAGHVIEFVEGPLSPLDQTVMTIKSASGMDVQFQLVGMKAWVGMSPDSRGNRGRSESATILSITEISSDNWPENCSQQTIVGMKCNCDLRTLRPLQGAVGMEEVRKKAKDIRNGEKTRFDLAYDPIKIARDPIRLYVTDHHHGARAWLEAGHTIGTCQIQYATELNEGYYGTIWRYLKDNKLVRLADQNGNPLSERYLPEKLQDLPDDPYRALAWRVRKKDGFCRALMTGNTEFAEFQWADWLRKRPEFKNPPGPNEDWSKRKRDEAVALAKTSAAAGLPGYRGDKPSGYTCAPDPD
jgi:hypothetical protein